MKRRILGAIFAASLFATSALAQSQQPGWMLPFPGNGGGGGGGGGSGTVTSIATSCAVSGGPITTTGTITGTVITETVASGSAYTFLASDCGKLKVLSDATPRAPSLPTASFVAGNFINIDNAGSGAETITPTTGTICGAATVVLQQKQGIGVALDGSGNWQCGGGPYVLGPASAVNGHVAIFSGVTGQLLADGGAPGVGTVTSVAATLTAGLLSIAGSPITTAGTLAFALAGTSGGVPYFNSASTWASSAVLATNQLMVGGGVANPPGTVTTGANVLTALAAAINAATGLPNVVGTPATGNLLNWGPGVQDSGVVAANVPAHQTNVVTFGVLAKANSAVPFGATDGTGYVTNDTITVASTGGTCPTPVVLTVTASAGAITSLAVTTAGSCTVIPANNPATQASTSGAGTGGVFVITWGALAQTYTPTAGTKVVKVCALGPGGGAGSGALQAASTAASGGAGGGGGSILVGTFTAAQIGVSKAVQIGIGGNGGTPPIANSTAGGNGSAPTVATIFGATLMSMPLSGGGAGGQLGAVTSGGGGGAGYTAGGSSTNATGGGAGQGGVAGGTGVNALGAGNLFGGGGGGGSGATGGAGTSGAVAGGGAGGGSGGGLTSGSATNSGANGGPNDATGIALAGGLLGAANTSGQPGNNQTNPTCEAMSGSGGGGGGSAATTTVAGSGGIGGFGAGGGGGGDAINGVGSAAGWGGRGGDGQIIAIEYF